MTVVSGAVSAMGTMKQAQGAAATANFQSEMARRNAMISDWNADRATKQGAIDADKQSLKTEQIKGMQRAGLASQGGDVNVGSNVDILADTARAGKFDEDTIRSNAALKAYGYKLQGAGASAEASMYSSQAANATANLPFAIAGTIAGTAASAAGKYASFKKAGAWDEW